MVSPELTQRLTRQSAISSDSTTNLIAREGCSRDINQWYSLYSSFRISHPEADCELLPDLWQTLLTDGSLQLLVVEDRNKPNDSRIVSCCAIIFVTDAFCAETKTTLPPWPGLELPRLYLSHELPVLTLPEIAHANANGGVNVLVCFEGRDITDLSREESVNLLQRQVGSVHEALRGYQIKELLAHPIGEEHSRQMVEAGAQLRRDYREYFERDGIPIPDLVYQPRLVGLTKEEAMQHPGSHFAALFVSPRPRFGFTAAEQALLHRALLGDTSEQAATALFLSPWTMKKRWHSIYERVAHIDPELLPPAVAGGLHSQSRGSERMRPLLAYLRQHPEELRPFANSTLNSRQTACVPGPKMSLRRCGKEKRLSSFLGCRAALG